MATKQLRSGSFLGSGATAGGHLGAPTRRQSRALSFVVKDATNVKVFVRVRPFNDRETAKGNDDPCVAFEGKHVLGINPETREKDSHAFAFDDTFWSIKDGTHNFATQSDIYNQVGPAILENVFQGYNACLFAYGQTGAGKSYTMMGSREDREQRGIIPRLCEELYSRMATEKSGRTYQVKVSYIEIYCEKLRDLLGPAHLKPGEGIRVRDDPKYGPWIDGARTVICNSLADVQKLMKHGDSMRVTAATGMNPVSSRSHAVFTILFEQYQKNEDGKMRSWLSKINLIDLAGSERVSDTGAEGLTAKEGTLINLSLSTLGRVIDALVKLSNKEKNVIPPYRDSTLTRVLMDSLGGNSKTMMFANISPAACNYGDTITTLQFASRTRKIVNTAHVNTDSSGAMMDKLSAELEALRNKLANAKNDEQQEEIDHLQTQLDQQNALVEKLKGEAVKLEQAMHGEAEARAELTQMATKLKMMDNVKHELALATDKIDRKEEQLNDLAKDKANLQREVGKVRDELGCRVKSLESRLAAAEKENASLTTSIADKDNQLRTTRTDADATMAELQAKLAESERRAHMFEMGLKDCESNKAVLNASLEGSRSAVSSLEREHADIYRKLRDTQTELAAAKRRIDQLEGTVQEKNHFEDEVTTQLGSSAMRIHQLETEANTWKTKYLVEHDANSKLQDQLDSAIVEAAVARKRIQKERNEKQEAEGKLRGERQRAGDFLSNLAELEEKLHKVDVREANYASRTLSPEKSRSREYAVDSCIASQKELIRQLQEKNAEYRSGLQRIEEAVKRGDYQRCGPICAAVRSATQ